MSTTLDLPPSVRIALANWRGQASQMDAVAADLERAGCSADFTRAMAVTLREQADLFEADERAMVSS